MAKPLKSKEDKSSEVTPKFDWEAELKGLLKAELARRNLKYPDLVKRLAAVGVTENEPNLRNKISRGNFSAVFLLQCLMALEVRQLALNQFPYAPGTEPDTPERRELKDLIEKIKREVGGQ